jgi:hypothetical protein
MVTVARRIATVVTVFTLAGAPAVVSACVTLCLPEMAGHVRVDGWTGMAGPDTRLVASPSSATVHDHHAMAHGDDAVAPPLPTASARWTATCDDCCPAGVATTAQAVAPLRQQSQALLATLTAQDSAAVIWLPETRPRLTAPPPTPPSPPRTPAVLRI